ncbi:cytochrome P450 family protein [Hyalangium versicolor]|uniref:cytochrome P450 family protein n=1 Tax=Hyalangium versicolor TaxID=2861190 RepID=UPI001CC98D93|nr:cytochrome P450 [Hyalangium versicolor]
MSAPEPRFDLWSPEARVDPLSLYARMRQEAPVARVLSPTQRVPMWIVSRYRDTQELLRDTRFTKDKYKLADEDRLRYFRVEEIEQIDKHMLNSDPPVHTRLRSLVSQAFTARRVEALRPRILAIAQRLLDSFPPGGNVDLLEAFAFPLPVTVIAELLGVPLEDQDRFREWTLTLVSPPHSNNLEPLRKAAIHFQQYLQDFLARRRAEPQDDLTSALIAAEQEGDRLTPVELTSMVFLLLVAGHETTVNLVTNGVWALLKHPEQLERLRGDPSLIESAVEEMLRYCGPVNHTTSRFAQQDTEFLGQVIPAGQMIMASLLSANHDPEQFPQPERLDITRSPNRHLSFGAGMHFCLGAPLARLEAMLAINLLLQRLPHMRFAVDPSMLRWRTGMLIHGLERLPIAF